MTHQSARSFLSLILLSLLLVLHCADLQFAPEYSFYPIVFAGVASSLLSLFFPQSSLVFCGAALCVLPFFGNSGLNFMICCWLLGFEFRRMFLLEGGKPGDSSAAILCLYAFGAIALCFVMEEVRAVQFQYDPLLAATLYRGGGLRAIIFYLWENARNWDTGPLLIAGYIQAAFLFSAVYERVRERGGQEEFLFGLALGVLSALAVLILQLFNLFPGLNYNRTAFWVYTGRYSGTFSDPNSLGVMAAILVPLFWHFPAERRGLLFRLTAMLLFCFAPWSGSRTFWVGMFMWFCFLLYWSLKDRPSSAKTGSFIARAALLLVPLIAILAVFVNPTANKFLQENSASPGVHRLLQTLNPAEASAMVSSRLVFSRIAIQVWRGAPLLGVGLARFYELQEGAANAIGVDLGSWRDNANNFYLQILAEGGLLGLSLMLFAFFLFWRGLSGGKRQSLGLMRFCLLSAAVLLLTGPHLYFDELKYLLAVILAFGALEADYVQPAVVWRTRKHVLSLAAICPILAMIFFVHVEPTKVRGLYSKEHGKDGFYVWTGQEAVFNFCPKSREDISVDVQALNPDLSDQPLTVVMVVEDEMQRSDLQVVKLTQPGWTHVPFNYEGPIEPDKGLTFTLHSSRIWSPSQFAGGDGRWFGVMLRWPQLCQAS